MAIVSMEYNQSKFFWFFSHGRPGKQFFAAKGL